MFPDTVTTDETAGDGVDEVPLGLTFIPVTTSVSLTPLLDTCRCVSPP